MLKASLAMVGYLHRLICLVWREGKAPVDWKRAVLVALYKGKGDQRVCDNLGGISLLSIPGKVYAALLLRRLAAHFDAQLLEAQCGFRKGRGLTDAVFTLRMLMSRAYEYATPLHMAFIDLRKAFDCIPRDALWRVLRVYGAPPKLVSLLWDLHTGTAALVRLNGRLGAPFAVTAGVRQGCVIAPLLFNVFIDFVARQALARMPPSSGVSISYAYDGGLTPAAQAVFESCVPLLMYADDMVLTCPSAEALVQFLVAMDDVCTACGLTINAAKTEVMSVDRVVKDNRGRPMRVRDPLPVITLRGGSIKQVDKFKYLGSILTSDCSCAADVDARLSKAAAASASLRHAWQAPIRALPLCSKMHVYKSCVLPILLFGCESWATTSAELQRLNSLHNSCLRQILGVRLADRHSNDTLYKACGTAPIEAYVRAARLRQLGHVVRMPSSRMPKQVLFALPPAPVRPPGGTRTTLLGRLKEDCVHARIDPAALDTLCHNRPLWRDCTRAVARMN